jgi:hypothetical protein
MSHADFDVVTGPSMPQRRAPPPRQSRGSLENKSNPTAPLPTPAATPGDAGEKQR